MITNHCEKEGPGAGGWTAVMTAHTHMSKQAGHLRVHSNARLLLMILRSAACENLITWFDVRRHILPELDETAACERQ